MCRGDRPVAPTGVGDGDQPGCADRKRRLGAPALVGIFMHTEACAPGRCARALPTNWEQDVVEKLSSLLVAPPSIASFEFLQKIL